MADDLRNKFVDEHEDSINKSSYKYAFGSFVAVRIDVDRKKYGIRQERNAADSS